MDDTSAVGKIDTSEKLLRRSQHRVWTQYFPERRAGMYDLRDAWSNQLSDQAAMDAIRTTDLERIYETAEASRFLAALSFVELLECNYGLDLVVISHATA